MTTYFRYRVKLVDNGKRILIDARDSGGETLAGHPKGECALSGVPERIAELTKKVKNETAKHEEMHELGEALFNALFSAEVRSEIRGLVAQLSQGELLRLELDFGEDTMPEVAALPWEFLRASETLDNVAGDWGTSTRVILSRRRDLHEPAPAIILNEPLRIQLVVAAPADLGPVEYRPVEAALKEMAQKHPTMMAPPLKTLLQPDATQLDHTLEENKPHIVHFIGHGRMHTLRKMQVAQLALVAASRSADWRNDEDIGEILGAHRIGMVLIQACESGAAGDVEAFTGVASQIVQQNVPVVVAMQYPISNDAAITFAEEFYRRLGKLEPVDYAVQMARRVLAQQYKETRDYATPVLFMRVKDGQLFRPGNPGASVGSFPEDWVETLPHPLAAACVKFNSARSDNERFDTLDGLLANLVKYLNAIALSLYWQDKPDPNELRGWLGELVESRLTTTLGILNRVADHYAASQSKPPLYPLLFQPYAEAVPDHSPIANAYQELRRLFPGDRVRAEEITPRTFLARWLAFREAKWEAHPAGAPVELHGPLLPCLRRALEDLMTTFRNLWIYPLLYIERVDPHGAEWKYTLVAFPGASGEPKIVEPLCEPKHGRPSHQRDYLYLCSPGRDYLLNLHPFLIGHLHRLYFLERAADKQQIWYRHCATGEPYQPPEFYKFLSQSWNEAAPQVDEPDSIREIREANDVLQKEENKRHTDTMPISIVMAHLDGEAQRALCIGLGESLRIGQFWLGVEFLLMGLSKIEDGILPRVLEDIGAEPSNLRGMLRGLTDVRARDWREQRDVEGLGKQAIADLKEADTATLRKWYGTSAMPKAVVTPRLMTVLRNAVQLAGKERVGQAHLLYAAVLVPQILAVNVLYTVVANSGRDPRELPRWVEQSMQASPAAPQAPPRLADAGQAPRQPMVKPLPPAQGPLGQIGRDLNALARAKKLHPAIGENAHKAILQIGTILQQTQANNPILLGDPGVGKTAIVEGFAWRLAVGEEHDQPVAPQLANKRVIDLPAAALLAGTKYRGDLEDRLQKILAEVRDSNGRIVVFIDEIHTILGGRAEGGLGAIADALKPALARGEFPCIGATTVGEYRRYIEADPALARRFTPVWIDEPSEKDACEIVTEVVKQVLAPSHLVEYPPEVIVEAVHLSMRYLHDEFLPGKAVKLLDQAGPRVIMGQSLRGIALKDAKVARVVTPETVRTIVSERTGIPMTRLSQDESGRLSRLEQDLKTRVKGQDEAIREVVRVVKRARAGLADPRRPLGIFLFAGPTGVGKTELALAVAEALFDEEDAILRLDMSEFMEKHQVARLIGSPPGYIGHEEEGQLTGRLRRRPFSVVLLDEIERAHPDVQHLFLQLFDAGRITDSRGYVADGRNAIFIMTTNLGAKEAMGLTREKETYKAKLQAAINDHFTPEFLNRVDRTIYFAPLSEGAILAIFDKLFARVQERFQAQGITVRVTEAFKRELCARTRYTDETRGARPLARAIEDEIVVPLTEQLLAHELEAGMTIVVGESASSPTANPSLSSAPPPPPLPAQEPPREEQATGRPGMDPREQVGRAALGPLLNALRARLGEQAIELTVQEPAMELLSSPVWEDARGRYDSATAFMRLVREPLLARVQAGDVKPGDHVEVIRNVDKIDFRKIMEAKS